MLHAPAVQERNINIAVADVSKERQGARVPNRGGLRSELRPGCYCAAAAGAFAGSGI